MRKRDLDRQKGWREEEREKVSHKDATHLDIMDVSRIDGGYLKRLLRGEKFAKTYAEEQKRRKKADDEAFAAYCRKAEAEEIADQKELRRKDLLGVHGVNVDMRCVNMVQWPEKGVNMVNMLNMALREHTRRMVYQMLSLEDAQELSYFTKKVLMCVYEVRSGQRC